MKKIMFVVVLMFVFVLSVVYAKGDKIFGEMPFKSAKWAEKEEIKSSEHSFVKEKIIYYKNSNLRIESKGIAGQGKGKEDIIIISDKAMYVIDKDNNKGYMMSAGDESMDDIGERYNDEGDNKLKKIGSEKINGVACDVYEGTEEDMKMKMWMSKKNKFVMKKTVEGKGYEYVSVISNLKEGIKIDDSLFKPAKDVKITKIGDMGGMLTENMKQSMEDREQDSSESSNPAADLMKMFGQ